MSRCGDAREERSIQNTDGRADIEAKAQFLRKLFKNPTHLRNLNACANWSEIKSVAVQIQKVLQEKSKSFGSMTFVSLDVQTGFITSFLL